MCEAIMYIAVVCKLNCGYINQACFINTFQTENIFHCISAVKFDMGYEKNKGFLVVLKSPEI